MMKAFRGFKRFDDDLSPREERRTKPSLALKRRSKRDQSAQPFLNLEDSNGQSPINKFGRWEDLESNEDADENLNSFRKSFVPKTIHSDKIPFKNGENVTRHDDSRKDKGVIKKNRISSSRGQKQNSNVFDPFCLGDMESHGSGNGFFHPTGGEWDAFLSKPKSLEQCDFSEMLKTSPENMMDSLVLQNFESRHLEDLFETRNDKLSPEPDTILNAEQETEETGRKSRTGTEADTISVSSFPMRIKPIDFLKKRTVEEDDSYAGDVFLKMDESSHIRSWPSKRESMIETVKEEEEELSDVCTHMETDIQSNVDGVEVVDVETVYSSKDTGEAMSMTSEEMKPEKSSSEDNGEIIHQPSDKNAVDREGSTDDHSNRDTFTCPDIGLCQPSQCTTPSEHHITKPSSFSCDDKTEGQISDANKSVIDEAHKNQSPIKEANETNPLRQFAQLTAPILKAGSISLTDDPIKLAAEKLGLSAIDEPFEEQLQIPLNVKVKRKNSKISEAKQKKEVHNSIQAHSTNRKARRKNGKLESPSTGSLLDNATEVSDIYSASTSSGSTSVSKLQLQTIDLNSVNSGSVSSLSFQGKVTSKDSQDVGRSAEARRRGSSTKRRPLSRMKIPRGPTRRTKSDFTSVTEKPEGHIQTKKEDTKPLGASVNEIKMINKFLAVAGPEFDGTSLTIETREQIHNKALREGLTETFINKMLDQSAGIILWEQTSATSDDRSETTDVVKADTISPSGRTFRTKDTTDDNTKVTTETSFSEDLTFDEDGFVRKTPKEDTFSCLKNIFWMESSNVVGDDMTENILAVMSADSESIYSRKRQQRR
jgi:hypothetical protein